MLSGMIAEDLTTLATASFTVVYAMYDGSVTLQLTATQTQEQASHV